MSKNQNNAGKTDAPKVENQPGAEVNSPEAVAPGAEEASTENKDDEHHEPEAEQPAAETAPVVEATAAPAVAEVKKVVIPDNLIPTPPTETAIQKVAKKVIDRFAGMNLKDFDSIRTRLAQAGDVDLFGTAMMAPQRVFVVRKKDTPLTELKAMALDYREEDVKNEAGEVVGTRLYGYKMPKIRKAIGDGKKIDGVFHEKYKQHTVVVESPSTNGVLDPADTTGKTLLKIGAVAYWDTPLTEEDEKFLADKKAMKEKSDAEKEALRLAKKNEKLEKEKLASVQAAAGVTAATVAPGAEASATPSTDADNALQQQEDQPAEASKTKVN